MPKTQPQITTRPSPNCGPRRDGLTPSLVVLHYTAMHSAEAAIERLCDPAAEVSAHYLISITGAVTMMVPEDKRAWHAGAGSWRGQDDINSRSIGIELDNLGTHPFAEPQMASLETLLQAIMTRWGIAANGIIGHSDMAPGRKIDPGPHFDWARLARQGLAAQTVAQTPETVDEDSFASCAHAAGYPQDTPFETLLATTRLRSAPWRRGPLTHADYTLPSI
ncbi:N-acetylmuramoyl-L-alanine amidase [Sulfitobacter geojensis]|uniref:N-acetylmuramoyl-L-alanine amidase n=1 Tax=Sulfitobacter geojensis TaxID=1342299 RepID=UPI000468DF83|nr:N-acetylmuramoyl-L-alanine amidase [Sulfitobacter geojensis]KHA53066.1 N-acetylmuramoyl-L-alanine amidase [Sulfitobacter geojensis]NYI28284.1 N-acetylmuramoyl-L-alanine amidase [Sulfitobacter geojensis]